MKIVKNISPSYFGILALLLCAFIPHESISQTYNVKGKFVFADGNKQYKGSYVIIIETQQKSEINEKGEYKIEEVKTGSYQLATVAIGYATIVREIEVKDKDVTIDFKVKLLEQELKTMTFEAENANNYGIYKLNPIEGTAIYAGMKSEVINMDDVTANLATNNSRQIYSKVSGLNIWENDGAGMQLGIGGRGLSPSRASNFNMRQNGYDISADALGYPESYYSPPSEAVDQIEIVRGAAALQYGTQFGGMVNYQLKKGPDNKPFEVVSRQTAGSFNLINSFNSVGGNKGKLKYYAFYHYKSGKGWRPNSGFNNHTAHANLQYSFNKKLTVSTEYTYMTYLANQPGGLTDALFNEDPRQSIRDRNWFRVNWNLAAINMNYKFNTRTEINSKTFGLMAGRDALGYLGQISRLDPNEERDLLSDDYLNIGNETRFIKKYNLTKDNISAFLVGTRYYRGNTERKQGDASKNSDADFTFLNPSNPEHSAYQFPSENISIFVENLFQLNKKLSITPGVRYENIVTTADGYYKVENKNRADSVIYSNTINEDRRNSRSFVLFGVGLGYKLTKNTELYGNFSQNYRSINFNDMRVVNPNFEVDPNLKDESGYTADLGYRGNIEGLLYFDVTAFYLKYNDRIGEVLKTNPELFTPYRWRTNIADSRTLGIEGFAEVTLNKLFKFHSKHVFSIFNNISFMNARYMSSDESAFDNKNVELVPEVIYKSGLTWTFKRFKTVYQYSYTAQQYTDATNAEYTANAVNGIVPEFYIMDLSTSYNLERFSFFAGINNLTNNIYFTRRASGYPGPGIIPADGRNFYVTVQVRI